MSNNDENTKIEAKVHIDNALAKSPTEWLTIAEEELALGFAHFNAAVGQQCTPAELAAAHDLMKKVEKGRKKFQENARGRLALLVEQHGTTVTQAGSMELDLGNGRKQRIMPDTTKLDDDKVEAMLRAKSLDIDTYMDTTISHKANETKLKWLVEKQQVTQKEIEACRAARVWRVGKSMKAEESTDDDD